MTFVETEASDTSIHVDICMCKRDNNIVVCIY